MYLSDNDPRSLITFILTKFTLSGTSFRFDLLTNREHYFVRLLFITKARFSEIAIVGLDGTWEWMYEERSEEGKV